MDLVILCNNFAKLQIFVFFYAGFGRKLRAYIFCLKSKTQKLKAVKLSRHKTGQKDYLMWLTGS